MINQYHPPQQQFVQQPQFVQQQQQYFQHPQQFNPNQRGAFQGRGRGGNYHRAINNQQAQAQARRADIMSILASTALVRGGGRGGRQARTGNNRRY